MPFLVKPLYKEQLIAHREHEVVTTHHWYGPFEHTRIDPEPCKFGWDQHDAPNFFCFLPRWAGGLALATLHQLIPHGTKRCLSSANSGPAILVCILPDFIDLARKDYALGTARNVTGTKHIALVGAEEFEKIRPTLLLGGGQYVPSF